MLYAVPPSFDFRKDTDFRDLPNCQLTPEYCGMALELMLYNVAAAFSSTGDGAGIDFCSSYPSA